MAQNSRTLFFDIFARDFTATGMSSARTNVSRLGNTLRRVGSIAAGAALFGVARFAQQGVRNFMDFNQSMNETYAIMGNISGPMKDRMESAAREVGRTTRFSATEAADAYYYLAIAGFDAEQAISAMPQVANFAQAGMFDMKVATDLATDAQSALGMTSSDAQENLAGLTRVTDVFVATNTLANTSVEQIAEAMTNRAGPAMRSVGMEIEEGASVLAAFADQGIKGRRAGQQLAIVLRDLQTRANENADAFEEADIAVFDANGNLNNMADIVSDVEDHLEGMSDSQQRAALTTLGFNDRSVQSLMALLGTSDALREYQDELDEAAGLTAEVARNQLQSFEARWELVKSAVTDFGITVGDVMVRSTATVVETLGEMGSQFRSLPGWVQVAVGGLGTLPLTVPMIRGFATRVRTHFNNIRTSLANMSTAARNARLALGAIGLAVGAAIGIWARYAQQQVEVERRAQEVASTLDRQTGAITDNTREWLKHELQERGLIGTMAELGIEFGTLEDAISGNKDATQEINGILDENSNKFVEAYDGMVLFSGASETQTVRAGELGDGMEDLQTIFNEAKVVFGENEEVLGDGTGTMGEAEGAADELEGEMGDLAAATEDTTSATDELDQALRELTETAFGQEQAADAQQTTLNRLKEEIEQASEEGEGFTRTLEGNSQEAIDNRDTIRRLVEQTADMVREDAEAGLGKEALTEKAEEYKEQLEEELRQLGFNESEVREYTSTLDAVPAEVATAFQADTDDAQDEVDRFIRRNDGRVVRINVGTDESPVVRLEPGRQLARAGGGPIPGSPSDKDNRIAAVATGEYVVNARQASKHRRLLEAINSGSLPGFARGGMVGSLPSFARGGQVTGGTATGVEGLEENAAESDDTSEAFQRLLSVIQNLSSTGIDPLSETLQRQLHDALTLTQQHAGVDTPDSIDVLRQSLLPLTNQTIQTGDTVSSTWRRNRDDVSATSRGMAESTERMRQDQDASWLAATNRVDLSTDDMDRSMSWLQRSWQQSWGQVEADTTNAINEITRAQFRNLQQGLTSVETAFDNTADSVGTSWNRIRRGTADPIRYAIDGPFNRGIRAAWNRLNDDFDFGNPIAPITANFARGGEVHGPGTRTSDSIGARLSNEEFVVRADPAQQTLPFLNALNSGDGAALRAAQGWGEIGNTSGRGGGGSTWRTLWRHIRGEFPRARLTSDVRPGDPGMHGSGHAIDIAGPTRMDTASMLRYNRWIAGNFPASEQLIYTPGVNLLNGRPHNYNRATRAAHYDHVHWGATSAALSGAAVGTGAAWDPQAIVDEAFSDVDGMIDQLRERFPGQETMRTAAAAAEYSSDQVQDYARRQMEQITSVAAGAGSPEVRRAVRAVARDYEWHEGAQWRALDQLIQAESSWNPSAANPTSTARGLFQKMTSIHGPLAPTVTGQAEWGLNYIRNRYDTPSSAWAFHRANNWYDQGGLASGKGFMHKDVIRPERVLSGRQTEAFERLVDILDTRHGRAMLSGGTGGMSGLHVDNLEVKSVGAEFSTRQVIDNLAMHSAV